MLRKYLLPVLAGIGIIGAFFTAVWSEKKTEIPPIEFEPPSPPYKKYIAGAGIVEASSQNISIGSPFNEIVAKINVVEGDIVKKGDSLFELDLRTFNAQVETSKKKLELALVSLENQKVQFAFYEALSDKRAVSQQVYEQAFYDLKEAQTQVDVAKAVLEESKSFVERAIIKAPVDGKILQVNVHVGEIAPSVPYMTTQATLILMGTIDPLQLRVDIDEDDAWRYRKGSPAVTFVRGNSKIHFPLQFTRVEPYIVPKSSFTGDNIERIDTRVLQILYQFPNENLPIYPGQVLDVFIEDLEGQ